MEAQHITWQENVYIQYSFLGEDVAQVNISGHWIAVKLWLWAGFVMPGGIAGIVNEWQGGILRKYRFAHYENEALVNLQDDAEAMFKYYAKPNASKYYRMLNFVEKHALHLERQVAFDDKLGHLKGQLRYAEIAARLSRSPVTHGYGLDDGMFTWWQVRAIIEEARDVLVANLRYEREQALMKDIKAWQGEVAALFMAPAQEAA